MNSSPDSAFNALAAEKAIAGSRPPAAAELAADWQLKQELKQLETPTLPPQLHTRVLNQTSRRQKPAWWMGLAAAIILALGVGLIHQPTQQGGAAMVINDSDLQQLQLALATLDESARHTGQLATRQLAANLSLPIISLEELPYGPTLRQWTQRPQPNPEP